MSVHQAAVVYLEDEHRTCQKTCWQVGVDVEQPVVDLPVAVLHPLHGQVTGLHAGVDVEQPGGQYHTLPGAVVHFEHDHDTGPQV